MQNVRKKNLIVHYYESKTELQERTPSFIQHKYIEPQKESNEYAHKVMTVLNNRGIHQYKHIDRAQDKTNETGTCTTHIHIYIRYDPVYRVS